MRLFFVYKVYPTSIRASGLGASSVWARVGAMLTPFLAQVYVDVFYVSIFSISWCKYLYG